MNKTHTYIHMCAHTHAHIHMHAHTHTHTQRKGEGMGMLAQYTTTVSVITKKIMYLNFVAHKTVDNYTPKKFDFSSHFLTDIGHLS